MVSNVVEEVGFRERELVFKDRRHAGQVLADKLRPYVTSGDAQLLAIPAGGVPVACVVATVLSVPLDVAIVRKIQIPWNTEAGFGAVAWDGRVLLNETLTAELGLSAEIIAECVSRTRQIVYERVQRFRGSRPLPDLNSKTVVLVDDGLASGFTMLAAVESVRAQCPGNIIVAVPTGSANAIELIAPKVDKLLCLNIRGGQIFAVADAYEHWYDLSDQEVSELLVRTWRSK